MRFKLGRANRRRLFIDRLARLRPEETQGLRGEAPVGFAEADLKHEPWMGTQPANVAEIVGAELRQEHFGSQLPVLRLAEKSPF